MKKILILLAQEGFEEVEALTPADYLRRVGAKVDMISLGDSKIVRGAHQIQIITDGTLKDIYSANYDCIILPGGIPGALILQKDKRVIRIVEEFERNGKVIAAICAAPIVLDKAGVLKDRYYIIDSTMFTIENPVVTFSDIKIKRYVGYIGVFLL